MGMQTTSSVYDHGNVSHTNILTHIHTCMGMQIASSVYDHGNITHTNTHTPIHTHIHTCMGMQQPAQYMTTVTSYTHIYRH
jgi:hypothetical protein